MKHRIVSPSMLSADFGNLARDTKMIDRSAAEWVHIDVMDGVFVPNISFGFPVLKAIKANTAKFMDVHLMITQPERYVARFAEAGADLVTVHLEATEDIFSTIKLIRKSGAKVGVSIKPATPVSVLRNIIEEVDLVLIMSVEPGFGGQSFIPESLDKVRRLKEMINERNLDTLIEIDGGITADNAKQVFDAGCDIIVAGSAVFKAASPEDEIVKILNA